MANDPGVTPTSHPGFGQTIFRDNRFRFMFDFPSQSRWRPGAQFSNSSDPRRNEADRRAAAERWSHRLFEEATVEGTLPAAMTFFGQFVAHDISFDARPKLRPDAEPIWNHRSPRFDLDSVYGGGPIVSPQYFEAADPRFFVIGSNRGSGGSRPSLPERDLQRSGDNSMDWELTDALRRRRTAIIPDPRNDENIIVSQIHLALQLFHNRVVRETNCSFAQARCVLLRHYHQILENEFLAGVCGPTLVHELRASEDGTAFQLFKRRGYVPFEFALACFRFGHSMVGEGYHLNDQLRTQRQDHVLRFTREDLANNRQRDRMAHSHLDGGRVLPPRWTIQWDRFLDADGNTDGVQRAQAIDTRISTPLSGLPLESAHPIERSLPFRTLLRGSQIGLPTGQWVAKRVVGREKALPPLTAEEADPLWIYILREADRDPVPGGQLGPVGARIVAEVCVGLLVDDDRGELQDDIRDFVVWQGRDPNLRDLLEFAELPITQEEWHRQVIGGG